MDRDTDFLGRYRSISSKLKKRFLRKPNVAEASDQFGSLAKTLENQECSSYAAISSLAKARCEHTLSNMPAEAQALIDATHHFMHAEEVDHALKCPGFEENLTAGINCYNHAIRVYIELKQPALAATLSIQLADSLRKMEKPSEAMGHYQRAADLQYQSPLDCLHSLGQVASCKIETGDYDGALGVLTEMEYLAQERGSSGQGGRPIGAFSDVLANCQVSRVLLLMLLQPTPQRIRPEHAQTLERYAWESTEEVSPVVECLSEELFLLMQSVVMACQSRDMESLQALQADLWRHLTSEQNHLLHLVINKLSHADQETTFE
ncbi:40-kDa huntingtin-associated protein-like [Asterias rubens]|uniref:40-kDa huntingtin-associated protein-like n=1 Tax=Asterias rubens TaxID=7604 RepID=UPI0014559FD1|nr:40-kDa huntingtin-associated protein-like [Asterias rubens]